MKPSTSLVLVCAVLVWSAALAAQAVSARETLQFAWPDAAAFVDTDYVREISRERENRQVSHLHMTHRMRVVTLDDGKALEYSDHKRVEAAGDELQAVNAMLALWVPRTIVNADGYFRRIQGAAELRKLVGEMVEPRLQAAGQIPAFREYLEKMATDDGLARTAASDWHLLVTNWIDMSISGPRTVTEGRMPFFGGIVVATKNATAVVDRLTCKRAGRTHECVTLEYQSTVDGDQMAAALKALQGAANGLPGPIPVFMDYERTVRVTLETGTMLPHELTMTQRSTQRRDEKGVLVTLGDFERRHSRFDYEQ